MAIIPEGQKILNTAAEVNTTYGGPTSLKALNTWYTMNDVTETVQASIEEANSYGQISKMNSATIEIAEQNVYQSTGLVGTLSSIGNGVILGTEDTFAVTNDSGATKIFQIYGSIDMGVSIVGDSIMGIKLALNGEVIDETECKAWSIEGKAGKLVTNWMVEMEDGDEVALYVANFTNTTNISFSRGRIVATQVQ
jgi:hypothetical protein